MTSIQKNIEIPEGRHLRLDLTLPEGFPVGQAKVLVFISPDVETGRPVPLSELAADYWPPELLPQPQRGPCAAEDRFVRQ